MDVEVPRSEDLDFLALMVKKLRKVGRVYFAERVTYQAFLTYNDVRYSVVQGFKPSFDRETGRFGAIIKSAPIYNADVPDIIGIRPDVACQLELVCATCKNGESMWVLCVPSTMDNLLDGCPAPP